MAKQNRSKNSNIKHIILISYVGICLLMVVATLGLSFADTNTTESDLTSTATWTPSSFILTMRAEGYEEHEQHGQGRGNNAEEHSTPSATPIATVEQATATD